MWALTIVSALLVHQIPRTILWGAPKWKKVKHCSRSYVSVSLNVQNAKFCKDKFVPAFLVHSSEKLELFWRWNLRDILWTNLKSPIITCIMYHNMTLRPILAVRLALTYDLKHCYKEQGHDVWPLSRDLSSSIGLRVSLFHQVLVACQLPGQ